MSEPTDKDLPDEQLEEYLRGGSDVSRQYRQLHSADVPAELDRLVLRQAQEAVKSRPAKSRAWMRWSGPLALAASVVLVVSIVIESGVHDEVHVAAPVSAPVETRMLRESAEESAGPAERTASEPAAPARASAQSIQPIAAPRVVAPEPESPPLPEMKAEMPFADAERPARLEAIPQSVVTEPVTATARKREADTDKHDLSQVAVTGTSTSRGRTAGPRNTVAVPADASGAASPPVDEPSDYSDPEQWLRHIRELREQKKHDDADREWRRFRSVFPNHAVDETDSARGADR